MHMYALWRVAPPPRPACPGPTTSPPLRLALPARPHAVGHRLPRYPGTLRQIAVTGQGHDKPALAITIRTEAKPASLVDRYARPIVTGNAVAEAIDPFRMEALPSDVPLRTDLDLQATLMSGMLYRLVTRRIGKRHQRQRAREVFERFVPASVRGAIDDKTIEVRIGRRAHNPLLTATGFREEKPNIPWHGDKRLRLVIGG